MDWLPPGLKQLDIGSRPVLAGECVSMRARCPALTQNQGKEVNRQNLALYQNLAALFPYRNSAERSDLSVKRVLIVIVVGLILAFATTGLALANGGPHGGYTPTTDACAGCHRAHTAIGPNLLMVSSYDLCITCHGAAGSGANTNVDDGYYLSSRDDVGGDYNHGAANTPDNAPLLGGGFVNYRGVAVTSIHSPDGAEIAAWGNGVPRGSLADIAESLNCASCHDPHGSPNYRIINAEVNGTIVSVAQVDEGAAKDYDTEQWGAGTSSVCAACHGAYHVTRAGSGSNNDDDGGGNLDYGGDISTFAHRIDMPYTFGANVNPETVGLGGYYLPLAQSGSGDLVVCMTCHLPHGTSTAMVGNADLGGLPGETSATDSALLRIDNRGVCEVCHQK
jgi:predicted CXXCH cytochrome family protein